MRRIFLIAGASALLAACASHEPPKTYTALPPLEPAPAGAEPVPAEPRAEEPAAPRWAPFLPRRLPGADEETPARAAPPPRRPVAETLGRFTPVTEEARVSRRAPTRRRASTGRFRTITE